MNKQEGYGPTFAEINPEGEYLSEGSRIWTEEYRSPNGTVGVVAHSGVGFSRGDMDRKIELIAEEYGFDPKPLGNTGFDMLYRVPDGQTEEEIDADVEKVALLIANKTLELRGWKPEDVDYLDFGSSVGKGDMAGRLVAKLGMIKAQASNAMLACNSSGYLLNARLKDEESQGKKALLISVDVVTRLIRNAEEADIDSMQIFSNGAGSLAYTPGVDIKILADASRDQRDTVGITAIAPYGRSENKDTVIFQSGNITMGDMTLPPEGMLFRMKGKSTARFFVRLSAETIVEAYRTYKERFPGDEIDFVVGHQPSLLVNTLLKSTLERAGVNLPISDWGVVKDGNSSGATSLIAFNRSMSKYKPGQRGLYASYGAGGTSTCFVFEVGKGIPQV